MSRVTDRDVATLRWAARWRHVSAVQVHRLWELRRQVNPSGAPPGVRVAYRRLKVLVELGLVCYRDPLLAHGRGAYEVTREGLDAAGLRDWWAPRFSRTLMAHEAAVVDTALEVEAAGMRVVSERDARQDRRLHRQADGGYEGWAVAMPHKRRGAVHWPDLWAVSNGDTPERTAVEVELSAKDSGRLQRILRGYRVTGEAGAVDRVVYRSHNREILEAVRRVAGRVGLAVAGHDGNGDGSGQAGPPVVVVEEWRPDDG